MTTTKLLNTTNILKQSWEIYKKTWDLWILGGLVMILASIVNADGLSIAASVFTMFFAINLVENNLLGFKEVMQKISLNNLWRYFLATIPLFIFTILGLILFIIPGVYILIRYMFVPYYYATNENLSLEEAYREVKLKTKNILGNYFIVNILLGIVYIFITLLTVGFGILITAPMAIISSAIMYKKIFLK